ncbi:hypothetical protein M9435_006761 [Picochlorum sp. BPE23]|nr:hypothetical protein M9435_006761 [Picochlorum sp. BPE23]
MVAFDREKYFVESIESVLRAKGSEGYILLVAIDGQQSGAPNVGWERIVQYAEGLAELCSQKLLPMRDIKISVAHRNLGVWKNKKRAVAWGFEYTDFLIVLEDDITLDVDALRWFEFQSQAGMHPEHARWAVTTCWSNLFPAHEDLSVKCQDILAVKHLKLLDKYIERPWGTPWGWAIWQKTWHMFGEEWTGNDQHLGWLIRNHSMVETLPVVARCNNIGSEGVNKRGLFAGHIQRRSLTSGMFPTALQCHYQPLSRSYSKEISEAQTYNEINRILRSGMEFSKRYNQTTDLSKVGEILVKYAEDNFATRTMSC